MEKTFLLGVGCQKGGTTWLHDYLERHPDVDMGFAKEYHVFDAMFVPEFRRFREENMRWRQLIGRRGLSPAGIRGFLQHRRFYTCIDSYFGYFRRLVEDSRIRLTGDITPAYAALPAEAFAYIKRESEARGFNVRVVFLMRDPVERCISAMRMVRRHGRGECSDDAEELRRLYRTPECVMRTRYDVTIRNLEVAFPRADIHYEFYEDLFIEGSLQALTEFLGLGYCPPDFGRRLNASGTSGCIPEDLRFEVSEYYRPTYEFVAARFGVERVGRVWPTLGVMQQKAARR